MAKLSIEITGRIRSALFVLSALREQGPEVARRVTEKVRASLEGGETPLDFLAQIRGLGQILKAAFDLMDERDKLLLAENQRRAALYRDREGVIARLRKRITGVRRIVRGHYVAPDTARLGLEGNTARESVALLRQSELICERLVRDDLADLLGESLFEPALDLRSYEPQIMPAVDALRDAHEAYQRAQRRTDDLLARRRQAVEEYDTSFLRVARQFEDLCRLAGLGELADKVRPSLRRRGETEVNPDGVEEPEPAEGDGAGDGPPAGDAAASEPASEPDAETVAEPVAETVAEPAVESGEPAAESAP